MTTKQQEATVHNLTILLGVSYGLLSQFKDRLSGVGLEKFNWLEKEIDKTYYKKEREDVKRDNQ